MMEKWQLPDGWEWVPIRDVADLYGGSTPRRSIQAFFGGEIIWITPTDLTTKGLIKTVTTSKTTLTQMGLDSCSARLLPKGTVLFSSRATIGKVAIAGTELATNQGLINFVCRPNVLNRYLAWVLRALTPQIKQLASSTTYLEISKRAMRDFTVPIPYPDDPERSLAEQRCIVARLEALLGEVREMRELVQSMQADIERVMDAVYEEAYPGKFDTLPEGWEMKTFPEVCEINPRRPRIQRNPDEPTSFVPMAAVDEISGSIIGMETVPYQKVRSGYRYFENGDVLFAKITPSMQNGKAAIADGLIDGFGFGSTEFHILRPKSGILPDWIYHYIRRKKFRREAQQRFRGAAGQQRVPQDFLETHEIPVPYPNDPKKSLNTQRLLVRRFNAVKEEVVRMKRSVQKDLNKLDVLEQSILAAAFRGEV